MNSCPGLSCKERDVVEAEEGLHHIDHVLYTDLSEGFDHFARRPRTDGRPAELAHCVAGMQVQSPVFQGLLASCAHSRVSEMFLGVSHDV